MTPPLGAGAPRTGARFVCFDAGPLIHFNDAEKLDLLAEWFGPVAYVPLAVIELELRKRPKQNKPTIAAPWLYWVPSHPDDAEFIAELLQRFGKGPPENQGEAEVVAVCMRYGWTAVLDDEQGRGAATENGVARVYGATLLAGAAAHGKLTPTQAWKLHVTFQRNGRFSPLKPDPAYKPVFVDFASNLRKLHERRGRPDWPLLLAEPHLDNLLLELLHEFRRTP